MPTFQLDIETRFLPADAQGLVNQYLAAIRQVGNAAASGSITAPQASTALRSAQVTARSGLIGQERAGLISAADRASITRVLNEKYTEAGVQVGELLAEQVRTFSPATILKQVNKVVGPAPPKEPYNPSTRQAATPGQLNPLQPRAAAFTSQVEEQAAMKRAQLAEVKYMEALKDLDVTTARLALARKDAAAPEIQALNDARRAQSAQRATGFQRVESSINQRPGRNVLPENERSFGQFAASRLLTTASYGGSAALLYGIVNQTRQAVEEALNLQKALAELRAQADGLGDSSGVSQFGSDLLSIARSTGVLGSQVVAVGIQMRGVFGDNASALEATAEAVRAAQVSGQPLAQVTNSLVAGSISYGVSIDTITDKTIGLEQRFGILKSESLTAFGDMAASAEAAGLTIDQVGGIIGVLAQRLGQGPAAAAGALDRILPTIGSKATDVLLKADATPVLKSSLPALQQEFGAGDTGQVLLTLANSWGQLDKVTQNYFLNLLASKRDIPYLNALLQGSAQINAEVANKGQDAGKAAAYQTAQQVTLGYQVQRMKEEFNQLVESLGKLGLLSGVALFVGAVQGGLTVLGGFAKILADINDTLKGAPGFFAAAVVGVIALQKAIEALQTASALGGAAKGILGRILGGAAAGEAGELAPAAGGAETAAGGGLLSGLFAGGGAAGIATGFGALALPAAGIAAGAYYYSNRNREKQQQQTAQAKLSEGDFSSVDQQFQQASKATAGDRYATGVVKDVFNKVLLDKAKVTLQAMSDAGVFTGTGINVKDLQTAANAGGEKGKLAGQAIVDIVRRQGSNPAVKDAADQAKAVAAAAADNGAAIAQSAQELQAAFQAGDISWAQYIAALKEQISVLSGVHTEEAAKTVTDLQHTLAAAVRTTGQGQVDAGYAIGIALAGNNAEIVAQLKAAQNAADRAFLDPGDPNAGLKNTAAQILADHAVADAIRQDGIKKVNLLYDLQVANAHGNSAIIAQINVARQDALAAYVDPTDPNAQLAQQVARAQAQDTAYTSGRSSAHDTASAQLDVRVAQAGQNKLLLAELAKERADVDYKYADDQAGRLRAEAARISADTALQDYLADASKAKSDLAIAVANSVGDVAKVAQLTVDQANAEVARAQANLANGSGDQASVDTAQAAAIKAKTDQTNQARQQREDDLAYLYQWDKITAQQYIASLTLELQKIPESNVAARREIETKINQVRKDLSSNLNFNIGDIKLPTYYDAKRLEAGGGVYGVASSGGVDNRVYNISLTGNSTTEIQAGFQTILDALGGPPRTGLRPRGY